MTGEPDAEDDALRLTRRWLERAVIGLNLCPFARAAHERGQIRWVLSGATTTRALLADLAREMQALVRAAPHEIDTTLIVHPRVLGGFLAFNDFLGVADAALAQLGLQGVLQIASFHPQYRFAGVAADDIGNCTNRAPYPTLHLLREASVSRAVAAAADVQAISGRNIQTLQRLGHSGWQALWNDAAEDRAGGS